MIQDMTLRYIVSVYVAIPVCSFGVIGNSLSVFVWTAINSKRSDSGKSAGLYLIALAFVDNGLLIFFLLTETTGQLFPSSLNDPFYIRFHAYVGFPIFFFFIVASIWMVIFVTVNRFIAVVYPHKAQDLNNLRITSICITITLIFSFLVNMPHFFNYELHQSNSTGKIVYSETETNYGVTNAAKYYDFWAHCMLLVLIPWITVFSLNVAIIHKLTSKKKFQVNAKAESNRERQTTIILLVISITFLVFLLWQCLTQCFWMLNFRKNDAQTWFDVDSAYAFARLGVVVYSSVNFVLYCLTGTMFRKQMYKVVRKKFGVYDDLNTSSSSTSVSSTKNTRSISLINTDTEDAVA